MDSIRIRIILSYSDPQKISCIERYTLTHGKDSSSQADFRIIIWLHIMAVLGRKYHRKPKKFVLDIVFSIEFLARKDAILSKWLFHGVDLLKVKMESRLRSR